jgi:hypothetical protein
MRTMVDEAMDSNSQFREAMKLRFTPTGTVNAWLDISSWFLESAYNRAILHKNQVVRIPF